MPHTLYLVPSGSGAGLTTVALGLVRALDKRGIRLGFFKPIGQPLGRDNGPERSSFFVRQVSSLQPTTPMSFAQAEQMMLSGRTEELLQMVVRDYQASCGNADIVVVEGLVDTSDMAGEAELNQRLVGALAADVVITGSLGAASVREFEDRLELTAAPYGGIAGGRVVGCIVNRVPRASGSSSARSGSAGLALGAVVTRPGWRVIGAIPENPELLACRTLDVARALDAEVLHEGELASRRVQRMSVLARTVPNLLGELTPGSLLVTPGDRADVFVAAAMAAVNQVPLAGVVLTGGIPLPPGILELCRPALRAGLPVLSVAADTWETATQLRQMSTEVPIDDLARVERCIDFVAEHIDVDFIAHHARAPVEARMSPAAFCHRLSELARVAKKRIVLPEGTEPRTIRAALICAEQGTARPVLLGDPEEVQRIAGSKGLVLHDIEILDPAKVRHKYVAPLVELRRHKGLTAKDAAELLEDNVWLGTMMLAAGEVDGLVSGAIHSTANTIRPALQVIKTKPGTKVVSSIFFMCLPENVVVYGDCAVNPDPDAETLADIAVQSADSAARFGITPRVAMISYSTGASGSGSDVDKVRQATEIAKKLRPELLIDGPLQYDAAAIADVAAQKAPESPVAGKATVFIFPDLNTGNTTYKAVQRSAHVTSIGPMLQGMRRPVNDLSRGALVEDIVYTIALTAIQAG